jgi:hypothetical protein
VLAGYDSSAFPGSKVVVTSAAGKPLLTVVATGGSPGRFGDAWVAPGDIAALRPSGAPATAQLLCTFTKAGNALQIAADVAALKQSCQHAHPARNGQVDSQRDVLGGGLEQARPLVQNGRHPQVTRRCPGRHPTTKIGSQNRTPPLPES